MNDPQAREIMVSGGDLWVMLSATIRYSLGRSTYMSALCTDLYSRYRWVLSREQRKQLAEEVRRELERAEQASFLVGHQCDHDAWRAFVAMIDAELAGAL